MDPKTVVWLFLLGVQTVVARHNPQVSTAYTLSTGMQTVQSVSVSSNNTRRHAGILLRCIPLRANHSAPLIFPNAQIGQIARLLEIPPSRLKIPANSLVTGGDETNTPLREALNTACGVRSRVEALAGVWREMPRDLELIVVLKVMRHIQRDSYRWVR